MMLPTADIKAAVNELINVYINKEDNLSTILSGKSKRYIIQYGHDLNGASIILGAGSIVDFQGGSLKNGNIDFNGASFNYSCGYNIFNDCKITNLSVPYIDIRWFGAVSDLTYNRKTLAWSGTDCHDALVCAMDCADANRSIPVKLIGSFYLGTTVVRHNNIRLVGDYCMSFDDANDNWYKPNLYADGITAFKLIQGGSKQGQNAVIYIRNVYCRGNSNRNSNFLDYSIYGAPCRPGSIKDSYFVNFNKAFYFYVPKDATSSTTYSTLEISGCRTSYNRYFLYGECLSSKYTAGIGNLHIHDNEIEQNLEGGIYLDHPSSSVVIDNNDLEGQPNAVYVDSYYPVTVNDNYFETHGKGKAGSYSIKLIGHVNNGSISVFNNVGIDPYVPPIIIQGEIINPKIYNNTKMKLFVNCNFLMREARDGFTDDNFERITKNKLRLHRVGNSDVNSLNNDVEYYEVNSKRAITFAQTDEVSLQKGSSFVAIFKICFLSNDNHTTCALNNLLYDLKGNVIRTDNNSIYIYDNFEVGKWYEVIYNNLEIGFPISKFNLAYNNHVLITEPIIYIGSKKDLTSMNYDLINYNN